MLDKFLSDIPLIIMSARTLRYSLIKEKARSRLHAHNLELNSRRQLARPTFTRVTLISLANSLRVWDFSAIANTKV
jgi:hypothetical protein